MAAAPPDAWEGILMNHIRCAPIPIRPIPQNNQNIVNEITPQSVQGILKQHAGVRIINITHRINSDSRSPNYKLIIGGGRAAEFYLNPMLLNKLFLKNIYDHSFDIDLVCLPTPPPPFPGNGNGNGHYTPLGWTRHIYDHPAFVRLLDEVKRDYANLFFRQELISHLYNVGANTIYNLPALANNLRNGSAFERYWFRLQNISVGTWQIKIRIPKRDGTEALFEFLDLKNALYEAALTFPLDRNYITIKGDDPGAGRFPIEYYWNRAGNTRLGAISIPVRPTSECRCVSLDILIKELGKLVGNYDTANRILGEEEVRRITTILAGIGLPNLDLNYTVDQSQVEYFQRPVQRPKYKKRLVRLLCLQNLGDQIGARGDMTMTPRQFLSFFSTNVFLHPIFNLKQPLLQEPTLSINARPYPFLSQIINSGLLAWYILNDSEDVKIKNQPLENTSQELRHLITQYNTRIERTQAELPNLGRIPQNYQRQIDWWVTTSLGDLSKFHTFVRNLIQTSNRNRERFLGSLNHFTYVDPDRDLKENIKNLLNQAYNPPNGLIPRDRVFHATRFSYPMEVIYISEDGVNKMGIIDTLPLGQVIYNINFLATTYKRSGLLNLDTFRNVRNTGNTLYEFELKDRGFIPVKYNQQTYQLRDENEILIPSWTKMYIKSKKWKYIADINTVEGERIQNYRLVYVVTLAQIPETYEQVKQDIVYTPPRLIMENNYGATLSLERIQRSIAEINGIIVEIQGRVNQLQRERGAARERKRVAEEQLRVAIEANREGSARRNEIERRMNQSNSELTQIENSVRDRIINDLRQQQRAPLEQRIQQLEVGIAAEERRVQPAIDRLRGIFQALNLRNEEINRELTNKQNEIGALQAERSALSSRGTVAATLAYLASFAGRQNATLARINELDDQIRARQVELGIIERQALDVAQNITDRQQEDAGVVAHLEEMDQALATDQAALGEINLRVFEAPADVVQQQLNADQRYQYFRNAYDVAYQELRNLGIAQVQAQAAVDAVNQELPRKQSEHEGFQRQLAEQIELLGLATQREAEMLQAAERVAEAAAEAAAAEAAAAERAAAAEAAAAERAAAAEAAAAERAAAAEAERVAREAKKARIIPRLDTLLYLYNNLIQRYEARLIEIDARLAALPAEIAAASNDQANRLHLQRQQLEALCANRLQTIFAQIYNNLRNWLNTINLNPAAIPFVWGAINQQLTANLPAQNLQDWPNFVSGVVVIAISPYSIFSAQYKQDVKVFVQNTINYIQQNCAQLPAIQDADERNIARRVELSHEQATITAERAIINTVVAADSIPRANIIILNRIQDNLNQIVDLDATIVQLSTFPFPTFPNDNSIFNIIPAANFETAPTDALRREIVSLDDIDNWIVENFGEGEPAATLTYTSLIPSAYQHLVSTPVTKFVRIDPSPEHNLAYPENQLRAPLNPYLLPLIASTIGNGTCLIHSLLTLVSERYRNHPNKGIIGQAFRQHQLTKFARNLAELEKYVDTTQFLTSQDLDSFQEKYKLNIIYHTYRVDNGHKYSTYIAHGVDGYSADGSIQLKYPGKPTIFIYADRQNHFEATFYAFSKLEEVNAKFLLNLFTHIGTDRRPIGNIYNCTPSIVAHPPPGGVLAVAAGGAGQGGGSSDSKKNKTYTRKQKKRAKKSNKITRKRI